MQLVTPGIVLKEQPVGESGKILTVLTGEAGIVRAFAHGARKTCGPLAAPCSLFAYSQFLFKSGRDAYNVASAEIIALFRELHSDIEKLSLVSYFAELAGFTVPADASAARFLRLMLNCIHFLCEGKQPPALIKAVYELKSMELAGYMPAIVGCRGCGCYDAPVMYYLPKDGSLCCGDCAAFVDDADRVLLTPGALTAFRYIVLTEFERVFAFSLSPASLSILAKVSELYVQHTFEHPFPTLAFYHSLFTGETAP